MIVYDVNLQKWSAEEDEFKVLLLEVPRNILITEDFKRIYKLRYDGQVIIMDSVEDEDFSNCNLHDVEKFIETTVKK